MLHTLPLDSLEVKTTDDPEQKVNGPFAEMVGVEGVEIVTLIGEEVAVHPTEPAVTE